MFNDKGAVGGREGEKQGGGNAGRAGGFNVVFEGEIENRAGAAVSAGAIDVENMFCQRDAVGDDGCFLAVWAGDSHLSPWLFRME